MKIYLEAMIILVWVYFCKLNFLINGRAKSKKDLYSVTK